MRRAEVRGGGGNSQTAGMLWHRKESRASVIPSETKCHTFWVSHKIFPKYYFRPVAPITSNSSALHIFSTLQETRINDCNEGRHHRTRCPVSGPQALLEYQCFTAHSGSMDTNLPVPNPAQVTCIPKVDRVPLSPRLHTQWNNIWLWLKKHHSVSQTKHNSFAYRKVLLPTQLDH